MMKLRKNLLVGLMAALLGLGLTACPDDNDDPADPAETEDDPGLEEDPILDS